MFTVREQSGSPGELCNSHGESSKLVDHRVVNLHILLCPGLGLRDVYEAEQVGEAVRASRAGTTCHRSIASSSLMRK